MTIKFHTPTQTKRGNQFSYYISAISSYSSEKLIATNYRLICHQFEREIMIIIPHASQKGSFYNSNLREKWVLHNTPFMLDSSLISPIWIFQVCSTTGHSFINYLFTTAATLRVKWKKQLDSKRRNTLEFAYTLTLCLCLKKITCNRQRSDAGLQNCPGGSHRIFL